MQSRRERLMPGGVPRYIRVYVQKPNTCADPWTVVFTGNYKNELNPDLPVGSCVFLGMSSNPTHPLGVGLSGYHETMIDWPSYAHLGKKIRFSDLPEPCRQMTLRHYCELWDLPHESTYHARI